MGDLNIRFQVADRLWRPKKVIKNIKYFNNNFFPYNGISDSPGLAFQATDTKGMPPCLAQHEFYLFIF